MVLRVAGLPVWVGPADLITAGRAVLGWTEGTVELVTALPARVDGLLDDLGVLVSRLAAIAARAESLLGRAEQLVGTLDGVLDGVRVVLTDVDDVATRADVIVKRVGPLLAEVATVAGAAAALVARADDVADGAGGLVARASGVAEDAAGLVTRAGTVADTAGTLVQRAGGVADRAGRVVGDAGITSDTVTRLIGLYQPLAERAAPLAQRFVEDFSEAELQAAIRLIDQLPAFTRHLETDIMPILVKLDHVGPDVHELLDVLKDVRLAVQGIPGFKMLRRRGEREEADAEAAENGG